MTLQKELGWEDLRAFVEQEHSAPKPRARASTRQAVRTSESGNSCEIDGQPYMKHLSCVTCTILVGPGHLEQGLDEFGRCGNCSLPEEERILGWIVTILDDEEEGLLEAA